MIKRKDEVTSQQGREEAAANKVGEPRETIKCAHSLSTSGHLRAHFITTKLINRSVQGPPKAAGERQGRGEGRAEGSAERKEGGRVAGLLYRK